MSDRRPKSSSTIGSRLRKRKLEADSLSPASASASASAPAPAPAPASGTRRTVKAKRKIASAAAQPADSPAWPVFSAPSVFSSSTLGVFQHDMELAAPPAKRRKKSAKSLPQPQPFRQPRLTLNPVPQPQAFSPPPSVLADLGKWRSGVTSQPGSQVELMDFRQYKGTSAQVKQSALNLGVPLGGGNQGGLRPESPHASSVLTPFMDYSRARPSQMLSQLSEVMLHSATMDGVNPTEIQFGYGLKKGRSGVDLFASANNPNVQDWLGKAMANPEEHILRAAKSSDPEMQKIGLKLIGHQQQQEQRWQAIKGSADKTQVRHDMHLSDAIHNGFLAGRVAVILNKGHRHAEQNIAEHMTVSGYTHGDIEGSKIRCMSCSASLNPNLTSAAGVDLVGKAYTSQSSPEKMEAILSRISKSKAHVHSGLPSRPRSNSLPAIQAIPKSTTTS